MRVLLVTLTDMLPLTLMEILNPTLEYCAIIVDDTDTAKNMLREVKTLQNIIHPFYELKECVNDLHYDLLIGVYDYRLREHLPNQLQKYGIGKNKFLAILPENTLENSFLLERSLRYYQNHFQEFEIFATGISYMAHGIDARFFKRKLFNFGRAAQDIYYNLQVAKFAINCSSRGVKNSPLKYALIGLAPYIFYYDQSLSVNETWRLLQYYVCFNDLHNFWLSADEYRNLFREEFLRQRLSLENFDTNNVYIEKRFKNSLGCAERIIARDGIDIWKDKNYTETRDENVKILDAYLTLCDENNIRAIMCLTPFTEGYIKYFSRRKLDEFYYIVREAMKKHPAAVFVDGWKIEGFPDLYFADVDHLNLKGAEKFSAILNDAIEHLEII